ncbi:site-specific integrase [Marinihelvus fidelis]|uniref:Site-specific integrase n=1 Tax=Marinihelvus fidelis TaxID=2613842 RepID=A0A5N0TFS1_9GAMM|nr:site-specific integrase [Marinihelvus fidelis]KAA9133471.1 site-specific integrase [Marinihelvus fidelis]
MEVVQPVRSKRKIRQMFEWLDERNPRDSLMWALGINTGLRVSDLLALRVRDVWFRGAAVEHLKLRDKKTGKLTRRYLVPSVRELVASYCDGRRPERYLFLSRQGRNRPITRSRADQVLKNAAKACRVPEVGTHSMRKTFGYQHYQQHNDLTLLMELLNHASEKETRKYIGITQDVMDDSLKGFDAMGGDDD